MLGRTDSRFRALVVLVAFVVVAASLTVRLAYWQVVRRDDLAAQARAQTTKPYDVATERGSIYDRSGTVVLATSVGRDRLAATPKLLSTVRRTEVAETLVGVLGLQDGAADTLRTKMASDAEYVVLARDLEPRTSERIRELGRGDDPELSGVILEPEALRVYPQPGGAPGTSLAAHLLGFVNRAGEGQYGVEQYYQDELSGMPRRIVAQKDAAGNPIPDTSVVVDAGMPGQDLTLTLDAALQVAVEQELLAAWISDRAKAVSAVVMDPYSGEVYAWASYPSYDANDYRTIAAEAPSRFVDPIVSTVYEPGSVFKMLTAVAALGEGTVTTRTKIKDTGTLRLDHGRERVDDADHYAMGWMKFEDAIAYSRNVVAAKVALKLGRTTKAASRVLYDTWRRMGFGSPTGIDVANEVAGIVRDPAVRPWAQIDLANGSFGQGIAVTPIQLAQAYAAMVNGGTLVQPRVVQAVGATETSTISHGQVMTPQLSSTLRHLMQHVVTEVDFYRDRTLIPGFEVGGKTGTAQIWDAERGRWKHNKFNYSFVGYIGRDRGRPDVVVAVRIEEGTPTVVRRGLLEMPVMSFELFRRIAHNAVNTPDLVPVRDPSATPTAAPPTGDPVPDDASTATSATAVP